MTRDRALKIGHYIGMPVFIMTSFLILGIGSLLSALSHFCITLAVHSADALDRTIKIIIDQFTWEDSFNDKD